MNAQLELLKEITDELNACIAKMDKEVDELNKALKQIKPPATFLTVNEHLPIRSVFWSEDLGFAINRHDPSTTLTWKQLSPDLKVIVYYYINKLIDQMIDNTNQIIEKVSSK